MIRYSYVGARATSLALSSMPRRGVLREYVFDLGADAPTPRAGYPLRLFIATGPGQARPSLLARWTQ
jgi:hypothetical protein